MWKKNKNVQLLCFTERAEINQNVHYFILILCSSLQSIISFANMHRLSKFFHQQINKEIFNVRQWTILTSPVLCCYTTLWNLKIEKPLISYLDCNTINRKQTRDSIVNHALSDGDAPTQQQHTPGKMKAVNLSVHICQSYDETLSVHFLWLTHLSPDIAGIFFKWTRIFRQNFTNLIYIHMQWQII